MTGTAAAPGGPAAPSRRREATRQRLLDAAGEVFAEQGLDAASVEAICERAGFTRGAFYSNFEGKDELLLALVSRVSEHKLDLVRDRIRELAAADDPSSPGEIVQQVLEVVIDERLGILLSGEIRLRAMRDPRLAELYLSWQGSMIDRVAAMIEELGATHGLVVRLPAHDFARVILQNWEDTAGYAVIAGLGFEDMRTLVAQRTAALATALVD